MKEAEPTREVRWGDWVIPSLVIAAGLAMIHASQNESQNTFGVTLIMAGLLGLGITARYNLKG
ncbi:MAG: hypothetical protein Q7R49_05640 [Candidatus Daviesbacteria bacterium]|nr:hypothetical protein [Candidatus Daviesbacteria bacterium]